MNNREALNYGIGWAMDKIERLTAENERLWNVLSWIDTFDPETTAAAEGKFGLDLQRRVTQQQAVRTGLEHLSNEELAKRVSYPEDRPYDPSKDPSRAGGNGGY